MADSSPDKNDARKSDPRPCTCHPDDNPPRPCPKRFAISECRAAAALWNKFTYAPSASEAPGETPRTEYETREAIAWAEAQGQHRIAAVIRQLERELAEQHRAACDATGEAIHWKNVTQGKSPFSAVSAIESPLTEAEWEAQRMGGDDRYAMGYNAGVAKIRSLLATRPERGTIMKTCPKCGTQWNAEPNECPECGPLYTKADMQAACELVRASFGAKPMIDKMVDRFLGWKLPEDFHPDAGISFSPYFNVEYNAKRGKPPQRHDPIGTNLFTADQARTMFEHCLGKAHRAEGGTKK